jgi:tetratricopeptide (TPR) repeat protein
MKRTGALIVALFSFGCAETPAHVAAPRPVPPAPATAPATTTAAPSASAAGSAPRSEQQPPLFDGLGPQKRKVSTTSAEAQRYFDQGAAFMAAFNHDEAERSFLRAAELDPSCAMAHWGVAMANGPHINNPEVDAAHAKAAWAAVGRAKAASKNASELEKLLVDAIGKRYADPQPADRTALDKAYADAMKAIHVRYPDDVDVATWLAEALMDLRPWDYWTAGGKPQPGTEEIVRLLEATMAKKPDLPLALHLYIHIIEASPHPEKADAAADRLRDLAPSLGHLVHMPSHIDIRRGRWSQAITTNEKAIVADVAYTKRSPKQGFYNLYMGHNRHMLSFAAMMLGQSEKALGAIRELVSKTDPAWARDNALIADGILAMPVEVLMRFGRWDEILAAPEPAEHFPLSRTLRRYARGVAYSAQGEVAKARAEQAAMLEESKKISKDAKLGNATGLAIAGIAESVLAGEIAVREGKTTEAIAHLRKGVEREDALLYDEPPDWIQPVRHALGATLIRSGKPKEAEAVYREDLRRNPENGWSLFGLERALKMQGKTDEAKAVSARFTAAWASADVKLSSSCFCLPGI